MTLVERVFGGEFKWEKKKSKVLIRPNHPNAPYLNTNHINQISLSELNTDILGIWDI